MSLKKSIFFKVQNNHEKITKIIQTANFYFLKNTPLAFVVPDEKTQSFMDDLLWKIPSFSFLPHSKDNSEIIQIPIFSPNLDLPKHIFNLCPFALSIPSFFTLYEWEDHSEEEKKKLSQKKLQTYQEQNIPIQSHF
jgi:hypothetical protein